MSLATTTETRCEEHRRYNLEYYHRKKLEDPDYNKKSWAKKKKRLIEEGRYEIYMKARVNAVTTSRARYRHRYLRPDIVKREAVIAALGGKCVCCGYDADVRALTLDHKNGDGYLDRKRLGSKIARYYYTRIDEAKKNLQVLCCNCNTIKSMENKEHNRSRRVHETPQQKD